MIRVFAAIVLHLDVLCASPGGAIVDLRARFSLEGEVVEPDAVAVVRPRLRLGSAQPDRRPGAGQVPDRLATLTLDLADPVVAERAEELRIERQAALDRRDDEVDVMNAGGAHEGLRVQRGGLSSSARAVAHRPSHDPRIEAALEQPLPQLALARHAAGRATRARRA